MKAVSQATYTVWSQIDLNIDTCTPKWKEIYQKCKKWSSLESGTTEDFYILHTSSCLPNILVIVQSLSCVWLFVTPWTAACQASLSFTISWSLLKLMFIESVILSNWSCNFKPGYLSEENENTNLKIYMHPNVHSKCSYFNSSSIC